MRLRTGRVASVNADKHTARVTFSDFAGEDDAVLESFDLLVLVTRPGDYSLPAQDALVVCALEEDSGGIGYVLGAIYSDADAPPLSDADQRSIESDDLRLGASDASDKVALAPATKDEIDKVLDFAKGIADAIKNAAPFVPNDGGASIIAAIRVLLVANVAPTIDEPAAEHVSAS